MTKLITHKSFKIKFIIACLMLCGLQKWEHNKWNWQTTLYNKFRSHFIFNVVIYFITHSQLYKVMCAGLKYAWGAHIWPLMWNSWMAFLSCYFPNHCFPEYFYGSDIRVGLRLSIFLGLSKQVTSLRPEGQVKSGVFIRCSTFRSAVSLSGQYSALWYSDSVFP